MDPVTELLGLVDRIHALWQEGKDESPEAESIRALADPLWRELTGPEAKRVREYAQSLSCVSRAQKQGSEGHACEDACQNPCEGACSDPCK